MTEKTSIPLGRYRHYKGNEYTVIGTAQHSETLEELVVYRPEYGEHGMWVRPRHMFSETVKVDGRDVPRFQPLGSSSEPNAEVIPVAPESGGMMDESQAWEVLESAYLSRKPWLTLRQDRVRLPGGAVIDEYFVLEYPPWVNVVAVTREDRVVMVRQYRHGLGRVGVELPAGVVDPGDPSLESAARRELLEETGYVGGAWQQLCVASANASTHSNLTYSFLAEGVEQVAPPTPEATEDIQVLTASVDDVARLVEAGQVVQALHLAPLLKYLLNRRLGDQ